MLLAVYNSCVPVTELVLLDLLEVTVFKPLLLLLLLFQQRIAN